MSVSDMAQFTAYLAGRNLSSGTIHLYHDSVARFFQRYHHLTPETLRQYKLDLLEHYRPRTVNLRIRSLNSYLEYQGFPCSPLTMVRTQQNTFLDRIISEADYRYLLRRLWEDEEYNYYFIVRLTAATGVRVSELLQFRVEDVQAGRKDLCSKGNKIRRIYIPSRLKASLLEWLSSQGRSHGPLFLNCFGTSLSACGIRYQLKIFAGRYGLDPEVMYPHSFRHRFAKNFIEHCGDIALLSDILGHENIETTRIYLRRSSTEQAQIVNQVVNW